MFPAVAGVQPETSRSIKPRERDLGDLRLFVLVRILTRPTNHPRHAACASNNESKPVRPLFFGGCEPTRNHPPSQAPRSIEKETPCLANAVAARVADAGAERVCQLGRCGRFQLRRVLRCLAALRVLLSKTLGRLPFPCLLNCEPVAGPIAH